MPSGFILEFAFSTQPYCTEIFPCGNFVVCLFLASTDCQGTVQRGRTIYTSTEAHKITYFPTSLPTLDFFSYILFLTPVILFPVIWDFLSLCCPPLDIISPRSITVLHEWDGLLLRGHDLIPATFQCPLQIPTALHPPPSLLPLSVSSLCLGQITQWYFLLWLKILLPIQLWKLCPSRVLGKIPPSFLGPTQRHFLQKVFLDFSYSKPTFLLCFPTYVPWPLSYSHCPDCTGGPTSLYSWGWHGT